MTDQVKLARGVVELDISTDLHIETLITDFRTSIGSGLYQTDLARLTERQLAEVDVDAFGRLAVGSVGFYQAALLIAKRNYVSGRWRLVNDVKYWSDWVDAAMPDRARIGPKTAAMISRIKTILNHYIPAVCDPLMRQPLIMNGSLIALSIEGKLAVDEPTGQVDADGRPITQVVVTDAASSIMGLTREELSDLRVEGITTIIDPLELKPGLFEELGPVVRSLKPDSDEAHRELYEQLITIGATQGRDALRAKLRALPIAPPAAPDTPEEQAAKEAQQDECEIVIYDIVTIKGEWLHTVTEYRVKCSSDHTASFVDLQLHGKFKMLAARTEKARIVMTPDT